MNSDNIHEFVGTMKQSELETTRYAHWTLWVLAVILILAASFLQSCGSSETSYTPPEWAPASADASSVPYYYFPDYGMYYDVGAQQYYYQNNGAWAASRVLPYNMDLDNSYTVTLDHNSSKPWLNHDYYARNYPAHAHEQYGNIVEQNMAIQNVPPTHVLTPRAYNENNNHILFDERARARAAQGQPGARIATHEVPMQSIAPHMPSDARQYRYGGAAKGR